MPAPRSARASPPLRHHRHAPLVAQLARFFVSSCLGLLVDLAVFVLVVAAGGQPWLANGASSACAVLTTYAAVTRFTFREKLSSSTLWRFVACYAVSIVVFSALIDGLAEVTGWAPLAAKVVILPLSFVVNYLLSRWIFR